MSYMTDYLLDYHYFENSFNMISMDLSKQQTLDAYPKAIQKFNLTRNLDQAWNTTFFVIGEKKETILDFLQFILL